MVKVDRRIRWHYTTTILRLRIGARLTRYRNCKFHNGCRTISRHADGISRYSVPPSAGPLLLPVVSYSNRARGIATVTGALYLEVQQSAVARGVVELALQLAQLAALLDVELVAQLVHRQLGVVQVAPQLGVLARQPLARRLALAQSTRQLRRRRRLLCDTLQVCTNPASVRLVCHSCL